MLIEFSRKKTHNLSLQRTQRAALPSLGYVGEKNFMNMIEKKWHDLKKWYIGIVELLSELIKHILLFLPKAILGIIGLLIFVFAAMKIGWWVAPIYIALLFLIAWIHSKFVK